MRRLALGAALLAAASPARALVEPLPDWTRRLRLGGAAAVRATAGRPRAGVDRNNSAGVQQAGVVLDADLAPDLSFWYDMNLIRQGQDRSAVRQQVYVRWDRVLGREWLNAKAGRAFTPFGEEYLRWDSIENPFVSYTTAFPWALDEGVLLFGDALPDGALSYAAAVQNGNDEFGFDDNAHKTVALKLSAKPSAWLYASASALYLGKQGNQASRGRAEFWLSGFNLEPLGPTSASMGASPANVISGHALEGDLRLTWPERGEGWLRYGRVRVRDGAGPQFHRTVHYGAAELLAWLPSRRKAYLAARYSVVGTFRPDLGYRFAGTEAAFPGPSNSSPYQPFRHDQRDLWRASLAAGWWWHPRVLLKAEVDFEDTRLIDAAKTPANLRLRGRREWFAAELAARF